MKRIVIVALGIAALVGSGRLLEQYAGAANNCVANAVPSSTDQDYSVDCNCPAMTEYTTDEAGNNSADLATCHTCSASYPSGCNPTSEHYDSVWPWTYPAGWKTTVCGFPHNFICSDQSDGTVGTAQPNAAKYETLTAGCQ